MGLVGNMFSLKGFEVGGRFAGTRSIITTASTLVPLAVGTVKLLLGVRTGSWPQKLWLKRTLEALAVDDGWSRLVVLLLGDPHLLEGGQGSQDGTTDPDGVFALGRSDDLDLHG